MYRYITVMRLITALVGTCTTVYATAAGPILPIGEKMPPDAVSIKNITLDDAMPYYAPIGQDGKLCIIQVMAAYENPLRYQYFMQGLMQGRTCWGYATSGRTDRESILQDAAALIAAGPHPQKTAVPGANPTVGTCHIRVSWNIRDNFWVTAKTSDCSLNEAPAVCTLAYPYDIVHQDGFVGDVNSEQTSSVLVYCNKPTSLHVSVENTNLSLHADQGIMRSRFYVGGIGQSSTNTTASPNVTIPVYSVINTKATSVGEYRGSIVVTVGWD